MQLQRLPKSFHKEMDKSIRQCVWGSSASDREVHLLNVDPKECDGVGLKRSKDVSRDHLVKLGWRVLTCEEKTWCKLLCEKYGFAEDGPMIFKQKQRFSNIWQGIIWSSNLLISCLCWKVNNGR